jgi:hypothetical protein
MKTTQVFATSAALAVLLLSSTGWARPVLVQLTSRAPDATKTLTSSAMIFSSAGHVYALSSESRVYSGGQGFMNEIDSAQGTFSANVVAADPGIGLALLEVVNPAHDFLAATLPAPSTSAQDGASVEILGQVSSILNSKSDRHAFPSLTSVLEVIGANIPASEVGASVIAGNDEWAGVVSDQFLTLTASQPTQLNFWDPFSTVTQGHLVVIPAQAATDWIEKVLSGKYVQGFSIAAADREQGVARWTSGPLTFAESCLPSSTPAGNVGDGDFPIGGADGSGVGGLIGTGRACKVAVSLASAPTPAFGVGAKYWASRVAQDLQGGTVSAEVWYFAATDPLFGGISRQAIGSLQEFFCAFAKGDSPLTLYFQNGQKIPGIDPKLQPLRTAANAMTLAITQWMDSPVMVTSSDTLALSHQIFFDAVVAEAETYYSIVKVADLDALLDRHGAYATAWEEVEFPGASLAMRLYPALQALRDERAKISSR